MSNDKFDLTPTHRESGHCCRHPDRAARAIRAFGARSATIDGVSYRQVGNADSIANEVFVGEFLVLFGTGIRKAATGTVRITIAGKSAPVFFAGAQGGFVGLNQVNTQIPAGVSGTATLSLYVQQPTGKHCDSEGWMMDRRPQEQRRRTSFSALRITIASNWRVSDERGVKRRFKIIGNLGRARPGRGTLTMDTERLVW